VTDTPTEARLRRRAVAALTEAADTHDEAMRYAYRLDLRSDAQRHREASERARRGVEELLVARPAPARQDLRRQHGLSEKELAVLQLIGNGLTNVAIAAQMSLSTNTVKTYIKGAYRKLGLRSRAQAVLWWSENGS
jgi:DNA-binding NarL/FixJ family response regulator